MDNNQLPNYLTLPAEDLSAASGGRFVLLPDQASLFQQMARAIADEIAANNQAGRPTRLILPVGPTGQYPLLVQICNQERISWKNVHSFNMDEYCDWQGRAIPGEHPLSFRGFMERTVFSRLDHGLGIPAGQIHFPDPLHLDEISAAIARAGGIDTCYGGVGYHGHIAFNEPPLSRWQQVPADEFRRSLTRLVVLAPETVVMNSIRNTGGDPQHFPPMGVTLGMADILAARRIRFYCPGGAWQRHVLRMALLGPQDVSYPVTLLRDHPDYILYADEETARPPASGLS